MDSVLKALGRNKIPSDADQDGMETKNGGRDRAISSTNYDLYNDDGELIDPKSEENRKDEVKRANVSIDCTKALVIFGFSNWSELEPGK